MKKDIVKDIVIEKKFMESFDGERIAYIDKTAKNPKANVIILHGLKEHCLRYVDFAQFLCSSGFNVIVPDLRLHGDSCENAFAPACSPDEVPAEYRKRLQNSRGLSKRKDIFERTIKDIQIFIDSISKNGLPLVIIGHSYGSFLAQKLFSIVPAEAFVITGSTYSHTSKVFLGKVMALFAACFKGEKRSELVEKKVFGNRNDDEKGGFKICNNFYRSLLKNCYRLYGRHFGKANAPASVLIMSGESDPMGESGKGTARLYKEFLKCGHKAQMRLYKGLRHELINEKTSSRDIQADILSFLDQAVL